MPGIAELALGAAPIAGGALLGVTAGNLKAPDVRGLILKDMDLLDRIPDDQPELKRAEGEHRPTHQRPYRRNREEPSAASCGCLLRGKLARHRGVHMCRAVHHHLVARQP
jgi:hypothetical protein